MITFRIKNKLKHLLYTLKGRNFFMKKIKISSKWVGNSYGGFYVHPNTLNNESVIYSVGIGTDISFDLELIQHLNCKVYAFDPTPKSINWIKNKNISKKFIFNDYGISGTKAIKPFFLPKNPDHVSGSLFEMKTVNTYNSINLNFETILSIMKTYKHRKIDLIKMDIEGSEYDIIEYIYKRKIEIDQILVEFHPHLIKDGKSKTKKSIGLLNEMGYKCFGISDSMLEYSFIKYKQ